jgi:hypothetical protein
VSFIFYSRRVFLQYLGYHIIVCFDCMYHSFYTVGNFYYYFDFNSKFLSAIL